MIVHSRLCFIAFICVFYTCFAQEIVERPITVDQLNIHNHRLNYEEIPEEIKSNIDLAKIYQIDPNTITNSHRPQYVESPGNKLQNSNRNTLHKIDLQNKNEVHDKFSVEIDEDDEDFKPNNHLRNKHAQIKTVLVKLLQNNEQKKMFASVLPILKVLTPPQRLAMASLISKQITTDARNPGLNIQQVKAMFGNNPNVTSDLMLPILLDIANMVRDAKDYIRFQPPKIPHAQLLRRSFVEEEIDPLMSHSLGESEESSPINRRPLAKSLEDTSRSLKVPEKIPAMIKNSNIESRADAEEDIDIEDETIDDDEENIEDNTTVPQDLLMVVFPLKNESVSENLGNFSLVLNETSEDLPVAEKLRALNRFIDRNGNLVVVRRPYWKPDTTNHITPHRTIPQRKPNVELPIQRRTPPPTRKTLIEMAKHKCELFTNTLCLDSLDYPSDAIMGSIRRNQAALNALLTDFPELSADSATDGLSVKQENKYTPEYYLNNNNRREDGIPTTSGFMCPSTVKYARPQKARATSGEWKYIVNTGEHTQTLRLEKCLRPREPCTYLTENFKSKCVQVYNYHRLLTWDQQNGLHMDIFKVPTCCSCHIEGYSVAFPPFSGRPETTSEHFPGENLNHDPYEDVQSSIRHSTRTSGFPAPIPVDSFGVLGDAHNVIPGSSFTKPNFIEDNPGLHDLKHLPIANQFDTLNSNFHTDVFQHQNVRNVKKPPRIPVNEIELQPYLEPPLKPVIPVSNNFLKNSDTKYKPFPNSHFKRGTQGTPNSNPVVNTVKRPTRRPLRKKILKTNSDQLAGASEIHENPTIINLQSFEDINNSAENYDNTSPKTSSIPPRSSTIKTVASTSKITIKNVAPTTERYRPKTTLPEYISKDSSMNRRVNYNYHPIIDFFEDTGKKEASDRMDSGDIYHSNEESDWRPMAPPVAFPLKSSDPNS